MLNLKQIKQFYPDAKNLSERNMLREYLQYKTLEIIFGTRYGSKLSFMGGTAIRIIYASDRFSEDLDFDNFGLSKTEFKALTEKVKAGLKKEGLDIETRNVYKNAYRCYLKISGVLYDFGLSGYREEKITIQLDTTKQAFGFNPSLKLVNKFGIFSEIRVNPPDILLSQKIGAVLGRKRLVGRDLYDLVYLASLTSPNTNYLNQQLGIKDLSSLKTKINQRLSKYDLNRLAQDISPFVSDQFKLNAVKKFDQWLKTCSFS